MPFLRISYMQTVLHHFHPSLSHFPLLVCPPTFSQSHDPLFFNYLAYLHIYVYNLLGPFSVVNMCII